MGRTPPVVTASLTNGVACAVAGPEECAALIEQVLRLRHTGWESVLSIGDHEFRTSNDGPYPNHQLRISVDPDRGYAAINYIDHDDPVMPAANSLNPVPPSGVALVFSGKTGVLFPAECAITIASARRALLEWLETRKRPNCIKWTVQTCRW